MDWQPIKSAPRDGNTRVDLWVLWPSGEQSRIADAVWCKGDPKCSEQNLDHENCRDYGNPGWVWEGVGFSDGGRKSLEFHRDEYDSVHCTITHWRPAPPPPNSPT
jgi:hypothetical protein